MIEVIDVHMHGHAGLTAAFLVGDGPSRILVDCGPASSSQAVLAALRERGVEDLRWILLTHVHLDHCGGVGRIARRYPQARIGVHKVGAKHIADPSKLWSAVAGLYGPNADALWGRPEPVDADRIVPFSGEETASCGEAVLRAIATPGHARHHVTWFEETTRSLITGDAVGMHQSAGDLWRATTPPAAFDRDVALTSIALLNEQPAERLYVSHFGAVVERNDAAACRSALDAGAQTLVQWSAAIEAAWQQGRRGEDLEQEMAAWLAEHEASGPPEARHLFDQTTALSLDVGGVTEWLERRHTARR